MIVDDRECMLRELQALDFKLYDLQLYLDTHPFDKDMLCLYQDTAMKRWKKEKSMKASTVH